MLGGEEPGVGRDLDARIAERGADVGIVEHGGGDTGVGFSRVPAARTTGETAVIGVVDGGGAVAGDHDERSEAVGERHAPEGAFGELDPALQRDAGDGRP